MLGSRIIAFRLRVGTRTSAKFQRTARVWPGSSLSRISSSVPGRYIHHFLDPENLPRTPFSPHGRDIGSLRSNRLIPGCRQLDPENPPRIASSRHRRDIGSLKSNLWDLGSTLLEPESLPKIGPSPHRAVTGSLKSNLLDPGCKPLDLEHLPQEEYWVAVSLRWKNIGRLSSNLLDSACRRLDCFCSPQEELEEERDRHSRTVGQVASLRQRARACPVAQSTESKLQCIFASIATESTPTAT